MIDGQINYLPDKNKTSDVSSPEKMGGEEEIDLSEPYRQSLCKTEVTGIPGIENMLRDIRKEIGTYQFFQVGYHHIPRSRDRAF